MSNDFRKAYGRIVARAWSDPVFAARIEQEPVAVLREYGIPAEEGARIVLPARPAFGAEQLRDDSAVGTLGSAGSIGTVCGTAGTVSTSGTWSPR